MKKFLLYFCSCIISYCLIMGLIHFVWVKATPKRLEQNFISSDISTVVLGSSNGGCSWVDYLIPHSRNFCGLARTMNGCYNTLKWIVEYNEHQIDTVLLCANLQGILYQNGELSFSKDEESVSLLSYDEFFQYSKRSPEYWKWIFTSFPYAYFHQKSFDSGYYRNDAYRMNDPALYKRVNNVLSLVGGDKYGFTEAKIRELCPAQIYYLKKIVQYCQDQNKTLIILCPPVAELPELIDDKGYRDLLRSELSENGLIADYSRFQFPDSTYYADLEHLNHKGATYFSNYIACNGLDLRTIADYCE